MTHPEILITKYIANKATEEEKDELLEHLWKFHNDIMGYVREWKGKKR